MNDAELFSLSERTLRLTESVRDAEAGWCDEAYSAVMARIWVGKRVQWELQGTRKNGEMNARVCSLSIFAVEKIGTADV